MAEIDQVNNFIFQKKKNTEQATKTTKKVIFD